MLQLSFDLITGLVTVTRGTLRTAADQSLQISVLSNGTPSLLATGDVIWLRAKPVGKTDTAVLFEGTLGVADRNATLVMYCGTVNGYTEAALALLHIGDGDAANDIASILVDGYLTMIPATGRQVKSSTFQLTLEADKDLPSDGSPASAPTPDADWVAHGHAQTLTDDQKAQARANIGAGTGGGAVTSVAGRTGAVTLAKGDVGLSNVDNTTDLNKPVSTAQAAINASLSGAINTPRILYVEPLSSFSGAAEIGNPAKPFLTAQAAFDAAVTLGAPCLIRQGFGNGGGITRQGDWPTGVELGGIGNIGDITLSGANGTDASESLDTPPSFQVGTPTDQAGLLFYQNGVTRKLGICNGFVDVAGADRTLHLTDANGVPLYASANEMATAVAAIDFGGGPIGSATGDVVAINTQNLGDVGSIATFGSYVWPWTINGGAKSGNPATEGQAITAVITCDGVVRCGNLIVIGGNGGFGTASQANGAGGVAIVTLTRLRANGEVSVNGGVGGNTGAAPGGALGSAEGYLLITGCEAISYAATPQVNHVCLDGNIATTNNGNYWTSANGAPSTNRFIPD